MKASQDARVDPTSELTAEYLADAEAAYGSTYNVGPRLKFIGTLVHDGTPVLLSASRAEDEYPLVTDNEG